MIKVSACAAIVMWCVKHGNPGYGREKRTLPTGDYQVTGGSNAGSISKSAGIRRLRRNRLYFCPLALKRAGRCPLGGAMPGFLFWSPSLVLKLGAKAWYPGYQRAKHTVANSAALTAPCERSG